MPKVKGSTIRPRLDYVQQKGGDLAKVLERVNPDFAQEVKKGILLNVWYDLNGYLEFCRSIDQVLGKNDLAMVWEMGRFSAEYAFKGIYKMFYKIGAPEWIMKMGLSVWKQYYDTGQARVVSEKAPRGKQARVCIEGFEFTGSLSPVFWHAVGGWIERSLELSGGKNSRVSQVEKHLFPKSSHEFLAQWD
jgi:hypothetical protein